MSDFLARVAARAVGRPPLATPRLPALFEEPGASDSRAGLEVVEEEFAAPAGTAHRGDEAGAASGVDAASPLERDARGRAREVDEPALRPGALPAAAPGGAETGTPVEPVAAPVTVREEAAAEQDRREPAGPAVVLRQRPELPPPGPALGSSPPQRAAAVVAVPAARAPEPSAAVAAAPGAEARAEQPPAVQVRIGRLEVRANLQEAQRPERARRERAAAPQELSLSDYLRGRREAG